MHKVRVNGFILPTTSGMVFFWEVECGTSVVGDGGGGCCRDDSGGAVIHTVMIVARWRRKEGEANSVPMGITVEREGFGQSGRREEEEGEGGREGAKEPARKGISR
jgi:hypothetical protein